MSRATRRQLRAERKRRLAEAADRLLRADKVDDADRNLKWIDTLDRLERAVRQSGRIQWGLAIGALSVLLVALAWSIRIPRAHLSIDLITRSVQFTTTNEWESAESTAVERVVASAMSTITLPEGLSDALEELGGPPTAIVADSGDLSVQQIVFSADSDVEVIANADEIEFVVHGGELQGTIFVQSAGLVLERPPMRMEAQLTVEALAPPETIGFRFRRQAENGTPATLRIRTQKPWSFPGLNAGQLSFRDELAAGSAVFGSTIEHGTIETLESGLTEELRRGDQLTLDGVRTKRLTLAQSPDGIHVSFEGTASKAIAGPEGFETNMKPSVLAYLYRQQPLAILWGAVAFVFGVAWRLREFMTRSR